MKERNAHRRWASAGWLVLSALAVAGAVRADADDPVPDGPAVAASCSACHQGGLSLHGRPVDQIAAAIRDIASGARPHPPVDFGDGSDAAIRALAEAVARP
jgi:cytochrome c553